MPTRTRFTRLLSLGLFASIGMGQAAADELIRINGSATLKPHLQALADAYAKKQPGVRFQFDGEHSADGFVALYNRQADLAASSRAIKENENALLKEGKGASELLVGFDALTILVHADNPLQAMSMGELADFYQESGNLRKWQQLGASFKGC